MAIDVKSINCPQCGSTDVEMISSTRIKCNSCGSQTLVKDIPEHQAVYNETHVHFDGKKSNESRMIGSVKSQFSEEQFIRDAWIKLAQADVPIDVFKENFGPVEHIEHETILDIITATVNYTANIGNDRQEPYIDYETYYERVVTRDSNGNERIESVPKQRQVTKYKTVTDWTPLSGSGTFCSKVAVENKPGVSLNEYAFMECIGEVLSDEENIGPVDEAKLKTLNNPNIANSKLKTKHKYDLRNSVNNSLPGDHVRGLNTDIAEIQERLTLLAVSTEYKAVLKYKNQKYEWRAFAFGKMDSFGDMIENKEDLSSAVRSMKDKIPKLAWDRVKVLSIITICMLVASAILSIAAPPCVPAIVFTAIAAISMFIAFCVRSNIVKNEVKKQVESEIENFSNDYKGKLLTVLNEKLKSLGAKPAKAKDLNNI